MDKVFAFIFVLISMTILFGGLASLLFFAFLKRLLKRLLLVGKITGRRSRQYAKLYWLLILGVVLYLTVDAVFPGRSFYADEFTSVTGQRLPSDAIIIAKDASYPDFHGDYSSAVQIQLTPGTYAGLLAKIQADTNLTTNGEFVTSYEFEQVSKNIDRAKIVHGFYRLHSGIGHFQFVGFYHDGKTIFIVVNKT